MHPVEISFASLQDLPRLCDLLGELFTLETDFSPDRARQMRGLGLILENPGLGRLFVVRVNGRVVGMANALISVSTAQGGRVLLLEDVILEKDYRNGGLGRRLVEHVLDWAAAEGMTRVTLLADKDNVPAQGFYRRLDFKPSSMTVLRRALG